MVIVIVQEKLAEVGFKVSIGESRGLSGVENLVVQSSVWRTGNLSSPLAICPDRIAYIDYRPI